MARPIVVVFEELATPTANITPPSLNGIVIGPAYDLLDYPDDAESILLEDTYGEKDLGLYTPPSVGDDAVIINDNGYPAQNPGSRVDHDSVQFTFKFPKVLLASTYLTNTYAPVLGATVTTDVLDQTLIEITGAPTTDFVQAGIQPGDKIILVSSLGTQIAIRTVISVGEPNANGLIDPGNETFLRVSQNLPASGVGVDQWTYDTLTECRIERELPIQTFTDPTDTFVTFPEPGTDKLVLKGGVSLDIQLTPRPTVAVPNPSTTTVSRKLSYTELYLSYRALRQDLQNVFRFDNSLIQTVDGIPTVVGLGKIDARNPLAVGVHIALQNSGTAPIYAYGVSSDDQVGYDNARDALSTRQDLYAFALLNQDINIIASYKTEFDAMANPNLALQTGVLQKFRMVFGNVPLPTATTIYEGSIAGVAQQPTGANTGKYRTITVANASTGDLNVRDVLPGDTVIIGLTPVASAWQNRRGAHKVSHVNFSQDYPTLGDDTEFEITPKTSRWDDSASAPSGDIELVIKAPDGTTKLSNLAQVNVVVNTGDILYKMLNPTLVGGPYSIEYLINASVTSPVVAITGFAITVTVDGTTHTTQDVADAINTHATVKTLILATNVINPGAIVNAISGPTDIVPVPGSFTSVVAQNDDMFNRLEDTSALFLTAGVKPGDVIEIPLDPNNYGPTAYVGRTLLYTVATVLNENRILIANGVDDTDQLAKELPHYFARDIQDRYVDNVLANAQNYRIRRLLTKDDQIRQLITIAQSIRSKRAVLTWGDIVVVNDLRDGSLPRSTNSERTLAGDQPGFYINAQVVGAVAGLPPQHGLTNLNLSGIKTIKHSQIYFKEEQLTQLSDGGFFIMTQDSEEALPYCIHQLTTDPTTLETGEVSVVKNVDFVAIDLRNIARPFIGVYNVTQEAVNEVFRAINDEAIKLTGQTIARVGPPLLKGSITSISISEFAADRIEVFFEGRVARPLNTIGLHLVL